MKGNTMNEIWQRIEEWVKKNIPAGYEPWSLAPAATPDAIHQAEKKIGVKLPEDVRKSYLIHDGCDGILENHRMLSIQEIPDYLQLARTTASNEKLMVTGAMHSLAWNFHWVPFTDCGAPSYVCIDFDPSKSSHSGQIIKVDLELAYGKVLASSFREFLSRFADELEAGKFKYDTDYEMILKQGEGWLFQN
jgi:cell wall assembly regulator SMI1